MSTVKSAFAMIAFNVWRVVGEVCPVLPNDFSQINVWKEKRIHLSRFSFYCVIFVDLILDTSSRFSFIKIFSLIFFSMYVMACINSTFSLQFGFNLQYVWIKEVILNNISDEAFSLCSKWEISETTWSSGL